MFHVAESKTQVPPPPPPHAKLPRPNACMRSHGARKPESQKARKLVYIICISNIPPNSALLSVHKTEHVLQSFAISNHTVCWHTIKHMFLILLGHGAIAPLLVEMLHSIGTEFQRYERIVNYWPVYAPQLEGAMCTLLRAVTAAITRQCGLLPSMQLHRPATSFGRTPARYGTFATHVIEQRIGSDQCDSC